MLEEQSVEASAALQPKTSKPLRLRAAFTDVQERFDSIASIVAAHDVELTVEYRDSSEVVLMGATRWQYYKALEGITPSAEEPQSLTTGQAPSAPGELKRDWPQEFLRLSVDYFATNSRGSPRQTVERYHLECELPVDGTGDVSIRVGDDQSAEIYLATWEGFAWGQSTLSEVVMRCLCLALLGTKDLPSFEDEYPWEFDEVALAIRERTASTIDAPLLHLSATEHFGQWSLQWSRAFSGAGWLDWRPEFQAAPHPLQAIWQAAAALDAQPPPLRPPKRRLSKSKRNGKLFGRLLLRDPPSTVAALIGVVQRYAKLTPASVRRLQVELLQTIFRVAFARRRTPGRWHKNGVRLKSRRYAAIVKSGVEAAADDFFAVGKDAPSTSEAGGSPSR